MAGQSNGRISIWNVKTKTLEFEFDTDDTPVTTCYFLHGAKNMVVMKRNELSFWSINGKRLKNKTAVNAEFNNLNISQDRTMVALTDNKQKVQLFSENGNMIKGFMFDEGIQSIAISPDNKKLGIGTKKGKVKLWNISKGILTKTILKTNGRINLLEFSNDGQYLAAGSDSFFLLSLQEDHPNVVYKDLYGAAYSSSFSPDGKEICFLEDLSPFAKIRDITDLNIPSIVKYKNGEDHIAPQIYISNPPKIVNERINYSKDLIEIRGAVFDDFGVRSLSINGTETPITENGNFIIHLPLAIGENTISLEAKDINGNIAMKRFVINRKNNDQVYDASTARNFLFAIGVDQYTEWPDLNNAVNDINGVSELLLASYNFEFANITLLKNEQANQNNIYQGLRALIEKITPQDNLVIYYSGHGHFDELLNEGYWVPSDAELDKPGDYISNTSILKIIENINAQHVFLVADACFSGSLFTTNRGTGNISYIEQLEKYKSRWGLASGRLELVSDGIKGGHSPFARVLLEYLANNEKKEFAISELIQYAKIRVAEETGQTPVGNPLRLIDDEGGEFIFRRRANSLSGRTSSIKGD